MGVTERSRLASYYNGNDYNASTNPGGLAKGGHRTNLVPAFQDVAAVGQDCANASANAQAAESQVGAWKDEHTVSGGTVSMLGANTVKISGGGDRTGIYKVGRAVFLNQTTSTYGHVVSSSYSSPNTNVIVDCVVDSGLTASGLMSFGQDPDNAPKQTTFPTIYTPTAVGVYN